MKRAIALRHYEDFVITTRPAALRLARPFLLIKGLVKKRPTGMAYYGTSVRRVGKTKIEVTFELPETIKARMHKAIKAGKQIRLLVL